MGLVQPAFLAAHHHDAMQSHTVPRPTEQQQQQEEQLEPGVLEGVPASEVQPFSPQQQQQQCEEVEGLGAGSEEQGSGLGVADGLVRLPTITGHAPMKHLQRMHPGSP